MAYGSKQYDPERAQARRKAEVELGAGSPEFRDWESNVAGGGDVKWRKEVIKKAPMQGQADDDSDELTTALGRDLGFEKSEYKGVPQYEDDDGDGKPTRTGTKGPGIYVPEGGAFGSGRPDKQIATFDTPQETLRKKYEPALSKMSADEKEITYRKARGMPIPEALSLRRDLREADEVAKVADEYSGQPAPRGPQPRGDTFAEFPELKPGGSKFLSSVLDSLSPAARNAMEGVEGGIDGRTPSDDELTIGPRKTPLEIAAGNAPAVAFNGRGPLLPEKRPAKYGDPLPPVVASAKGAGMAPPQEGTSFRDQVVRGAMAKRGYKIDAPADPKAEFLRDRQERRENVQRFTAYAEKFGPEKAALIFEAENGGQMPDYLTKIAGQYKQAPVKTPEQEKEIAGKETREFGEMYLRAYEQLKDPEAAARYAETVTGRKRPEGFSPFTISTSKDKDVATAKEKARVAKLDESAKAIQQMIDRNEDPDKYIASELARLNKDIAAEGGKPIEEKDLRGLLKIQGNSPQELQAISAKTKQTPEEATEAAIESAIEAWRKKDDGETMRGWTGKDIAKATAAPLVNPVALPYSLLKIAEGFLSPKSKALAEDPEWLKKNQSRILSRLIGAGHTPAQAQFKFDQALAEVAQ